jgi:hypothetical protein
MPLEKILLSNLISLKGLSVMKVSNDTDISHANFGRWLKGQKGGYVSEEKIAKVENHLGIEDGKLAPGIHRWLLKSMVTEEIEKVGTTLRSLVPGGVKIIYLLPKETFKGIIRYVYAFVPKVKTDVRIVLSIKALSLKDLVNETSALNLGLFGHGSEWYGGSVSDKKPIDSNLILPFATIQRIVEDTSLTVSDLDSILGISSLDQAWTWEKIAIMAESNGITPFETAKKIGLE